MATPQELAQAIIDRNNASIEFSQQLERDARNSANARLSQYGDNLAMYEDRFNEVYNPGMMANRAQAASSTEYATGLGDRLMQIARDARKKTGSGSKYFDPNSFYRPPTIQDLIAFLRPKIQPEYKNPISYNVPAVGIIPTPTAKPDRTGTADTIERRARFG